jgi:hypothetical protein
MKLCAWVLAYTISLIILALTNSGMSAWAEVPSVTEFQPDIRWGGRTVAVDVSPANSAIAFAATESGGLFFTNDSGARWFHMDPLRPFRMSDVKFAPPTQR